MIIFSQNSLASTFAATRQRRNTLFFQSQVFKAHMVPFVSSLFAFVQWNVLYGLADVYIGVGAATRQRELCPSIISNSNLYRM
jgi:hypothetical protein